MNSQVLMKIGVLGDLQGLPARHDWGMNNFALALDILKKRGIDTLLSLGDTAEGGNPDTYALYWEMIEERFGKDKLHHFACEGNHDIGNGHNPDFQGALNKALTGLRRPADPVYHEKISGYDFVAVSESANGVYSEEVCQQLENVLSRLTQEKPVFLISHFPPAQTMAASFDRYGIENLRSVLDKFPQVISFSGHTHWPLEDENCIWQGEFTAVTASSLAYACMEKDLFNGIGGLVPYGREAIQILYMELYSDRLEIERIHVLDDRTIGKWQIDLPYAPGKAVYTQERKKLFPAPGFAEEAGLLLRYDFGYWYLSVPRPAAGGFAQYYDVEITHLADGECIKARYVSDFFRQEKNKADRLFFRLPGEGIKGSELYRIEVFPVNSFGLRGKSLSIVEKTWRNYPFKDGKALCPQE